MEKKTVGAYTWWKFVNLYSMRFSCFHCSDLRIWPLQYWRTWELQQQHEQVHSGYVESELTAFEETIVKIVKLIAVGLVESVVNKRCADVASRIKVKTQEQGV